MGQFPNAKKGISKLFAGEIIGLIGAVITVITALLTVFFASNADTVAALVSLCLSLLSSISIFIASIIEVVGLFEGKKDHKFFLYAILFIILSLLLSLVAIFTENSSFINIASSAACNIIEVIVMFFVVEAVRKLIPNSASAKTGKTILILAGITMIIAVIAKVLSVFIPIAYYFLLLIALILDSVYYVLYLIFLGKAKKEL